VNEREFVVVPINVTFCGLNLQQDDLAWVTVVGWMLDHHQAILCCINFYRERNVPPPCLSPLLKTGGQQRALAQNFPTNFCLTQDERHVIDYLS
jgi:hypothetical protein